MREATGSALLVNIILTFIIIFISLLSSSINYSKAFKVNSRIINIIEEEHGYTSSAKERINSYLKNTGYIVSIGNTCRNQTFKNERITGTSLNNDNNGYKYCVYEYNESSGNRYYKVITYMYFDLPLISEIIKIPVSGETKSFYVG